MPRLLENHAPKMWDANPRAANDLRTAFQPPLDPPREVGAQSGPS
jgi:hypothetical protein